MKKYANYFVLSIIAVLMVGGGIYYSKNKIQIPKVTQTTTGQDVLRSCVITPSGGIKKTVVLGKFSTPYIPRYINNFSDINLSTTKGFVDAYYSASSHGWNNYLSLLDSGAKKEAKQVDVDSKGVYSKGFTDNFGKISEDALPVKYTHWIEINNQGKTYIIVVGEFKNQLDTQKYQGTTPIVVGVKQGSGFLITNDLFSDKFTNEIISKDYYSINNICQ